MIVESGGREKAARRRFFGIENRIQLRVRRVLHVEQLVIDVEVPIQIDVVFRDPAQVLHAVGVDRMDEQNSHSGSIELGQNLVQKQLLDRAAGESLDAVNAGAQDEQAARG